MSESLTVRNHNTVPKVNADLFCLFVCLFVYVSLNRRQCEGSVPVPTMQRGTSVRKYEYISGHLHWRAFPDFPGVGSLLSTGFIK